LRDTVVVGVSRVRGVICGEARSLPFREWVEEFDEKDIDRVCRGKREDEAVAGGGAGCVAMKFSRGVDFCDIWLGDVECEVFVTLREVLACRTAAREGMRGGGCTGGVGVRRPVQNVSILLVTIR
jgi:hypothetical protein